MIEQGRSALLYLFTHLGRKLSGLPHLLSTVQRIHLYNATNYIMLVAESQQ
ncbi:hypothetical protein [Halobacillus litoralis]|uniref:hypothetical protein n=1 Tax=Halobacillus litoralis TaxID=45668 RepID=UPI0013E8ED7E|nr:hypothetical protein [Halobacillus litoralis]